MLLPSAFTCDSQAPSFQQQSQQQNLQHSSMLFASPPASPPTTTTTYISSSGFSNILNTCRNLQSLLASPAPAPPAADFTPATGTTGLGINNTPVTNTSITITSLVDSPFDDTATITKQLPTPPLTHAPPPLKLRLRSRRSNNAVSSTTTATSTNSTSTNSTSTATTTTDDGALGTEGLSLQRRRIVKRANRQGVKRRRLVDEDTIPYTNTRITSTSLPSASSFPVDNDTDIPPSCLGEPFMPFSTGSLGSSSTVIPVLEDECDEDEVNGRSPPHTPKRSRIAPASLPLGLERGDYHALHLANIDDDNHSNSNSTTSTTATTPLSKTELQHQNQGKTTKETEEFWSAEDDRMLVELVLEKLKLSRQDWSECARSLGKRDRGVGRRWKSLVSSGEVGLLPAGGRGGNGGGVGRRGKIHGSWR